ncbi:hypothetical protein [Methanolobus profundi]|uniref:Uncharacterized protein n=1 Tax=Methanolobus profundi TaxID=487685 RepID=A0A1I4RSG8_9EURY|nr:hypothetical protein [Methanolobus profundi]SFM55207.1 hypothetical protein SAMN04488696_1559 [Methanolobus profundi]
MLTSTIITTTTSTISSTAAGIAMTTSPGLPEYGVLAVIALILLLSAKEILSASEKWNRSLDCSLNMTIMPLLVSFVAIVIFKISEII